MATGKRRLEGLEAFLLLILGGFAFAFLVRAEEFGATAALFPQIIAGLSLALLGAILAARFFQKGGKAVRRVAENEAPPPTDAVFWPAALGIQVVYVGLVMILGFPVATLLYLLISPVHMGYRQRSVLVSYAVLMTITVSAAFVYLFNVRLPDVLLWHWLANSR
jgi:tripartite tricarboxylate transporter TctB family protein